MFHSNFNVTLRLDGRWRHRCFSHSVFHVWLILLNNKNKNGVIHRFRIPNGRIHPTTVQSGGASLTFDPPVQKMSCNFCCYCCCCCCCCWRGFCGKLGRFQGQKNVWMWPGNLAACDTCKVAPFCQLIPPGAPQEINEWIPHFLVCGGRWGGGEGKGISVQYWIAKFVFDLILFHLEPCTFVAVIKRPKCVRKSQGNWKW